MTDIICLYGPKRSGKDTVADVLVREFGYTPLAFATPVRDATAAAYGLDRDWFREVSSNQDTKEVPLEVLGGLTPRAALVGAGMYFRDHVNRNHWADVAVRRIKALVAEGKRVVVTDCRFMNEARAVQDIGGVVVGVCRPETWTGRTDDQDRAEAAVYDGWYRVVDVALVNNGTLPDLNDVVRRALHPAHYGHLRPVVPGAPVTTRFTHYRGDVVGRNDDGTFVVQFQRGPYFTREHRGTFSRSELRAGLYDLGRALYEKGGFRFDELSDEGQLEVEEDYQICVRRS